MRLRALSPLLLVLASAVVGQSYSSSPGGFLSTEGDGYARFGQWPAGRLMFFDGEMRNRSLSLTAISYRRDMTSSFGGVGRAWTNVSVRIADCDMTKLSTTFSANPTSTPTQVFSASVSWPTLSAPTGSKPAAFAYHFPFSTMWMSAGKSDICVDYDFTGGTLANSRVWSTNVGYAYFMDSYVTGDYAWGSPTDLGTSGTGCIDSASSRPGTMRARTYAYGPTYGTTSFRNMHQLYTDSHRTAASATVVHALGFAGTINGTTFPGMSCNKLHVDPTQPTLYFFRTTSSTGSSGIVYPTGGMGLFPYAALLVGVDLWFQAAWNDSRLGSIKLSFGVKTALPAIPKSYARKVIYHWDPRLKYRFGLGPYADGYKNPIVRYTH